MLVSMALGIAAWGADCAQTTAVAQLQDALHRAETAYSALDLPGFEASVESARDLLPCLGEVVPPSTAAELHRAEGLAAFVASDADHAKEAFAAARRIDPGFRFPEAMVPADNPVLDVYSAYDLSKAQVVAIDAPPTGTLRVDGRPTRDRVPALPQLVQWVDPGGAPGISRYLWPGDPLPAWPQPPASATSHARRNLAVGAAISAVASGAMVGAEYGFHQQFEDSNTPTEHLAGLRTATNALGVGSVVALAGAVGLGVGAALVSP